MSTPEAQRTLDWFRTLVSEFVANLDPIDPGDGGLFLNWSSERAEHTATFDPDGSMWMLAEQLGGGDEAFEAIAAPGPSSERMVRAFYEWW